MKDYYIFSDSGSLIKIEKESTGTFKITLDHGTTPPRFSGESLKEKLLKFVLYLEKYGINTNNN